MKKFRLYYDTEKEIDWLNEMSDQGWKLTGFCLGVYTFEACEKGKYRYQEDMTQSFGKVSADYRNFMEDAGIEIVQVWGPWVILCKEADAGEFELFTDYESRLAHQQKMLKLFKICTILELICFFILMPGVAEGVTASIVGAAIVGVFIVAFAKMTLTIKLRINRLKAENGESGEQRKFLAAPVMLPAYLCYICALFINEDASEFMSGLRLGLLIVSCACFIVGIVWTFAKTRDNRLV